MANNKPLPETPGTNPSALSTDARLHRGRLLRHIFDDVQEPGIHNRKDGWVYVIEGALDDLSLAIEKGKWLSKLKFRRVARNSARQARIERPGGGNGSEPDKEEDANASQTVDLDRENLEVDPLERIRKLAAVNVSSKAQDVPRQMLICVSSHGSRIPIPAEDSGFDIIPANIGCSFSEGTYALQNDDSSNVLFGLNEWEDTDSIQLVGGTFTLKGVTSASQHEILARVLRLAVYIQTSLLLEQSLLKDMHVPLKYPRPRPIVTSTSTPNQQPFPTTPEPKDSTPKRSSLLPNGLLGLFSRTSLGRLARSNTIATDSGRSGSSLDLPQPEEPSYRPSFDAGMVFRRFSILGESRTPKKQPQETDSPFIAALKHVERSRGCLSTSTGVVFEPPMLLVHLSEREKHQPKRHLKGDEKVGLASVLGWDGREARGKGMAGIVGFVRQQEISVLYSQHIPPSSEVSTPPEDGSSTSRSSTISNLPRSGLKLCGKPRWITYQFFSKDPDADRTVGEAIQDLITKAEMPCEQTECRWKRGQHELQLIHGNTRIVVRIETGPSPEEEEEEDLAIQAWQTCATCGASTSKTPLSDAAWLYSFGKFLELLIYSPLIPTLSSSPCKHTASPLDSKGKPPDMRFNIIRSFSMGQGMVSFSLSQVEDIFELRVPRLQIQRGTEKAGRSPTESSQTSVETQGTPEDEKKVLRREIRLWWQGVSDHIDSLEEIIATSDAESEMKNHKSLPRLPSSDDAYDVFEGSRAAAAVLAPRAPFTSPITSLEAEYFAGYTPESSETKIVSTPNEESPAEVSGSIVTTPSAVGPSVPPKDDSAYKLVALRHGLQGLEQSLYTQLANTPSSSLNDVRRSFLSAAKGTQKRLTAWQKKHLGSKVSMVGELASTEPEWWQKGCHAVPGASIIIREDDWGSIIAFTLSTADYHKELANLTLNRPQAIGSSPSEVSLTSGGASSFFSVPTGYRFFSSTVQPDPDKDDAAWNEPEAHSAVITRKEHIRDPTSILSIRDVLRKATVPVDSASTKTGTVVSSASQQTSVARARPDVSLNMQPVGGQVITGTEKESVERLLHELENLPADSVSRPPSVLGSETESIGSSSKFDSHIRRATGASVVSNSTQSDATIGKEATKAVANASTSALASVVTAPPPIPLKEPPKVPPKDDLPSAPPSSFASTIASGLGTAVRYVMNSNQPSRATSPSLPKHHGLLGGAEFDAIDDRPHIKYDWTIGKRLKFSCTVYYAKQFDSLRRKCGIDDCFVKSLKRSTNWAAEGGKSRSNFWKTSDERFIIKTLVNAWNVADLQALIDLAPSYFRYVDSTANKATALAKLLGFYTIEIRNLETGAVQSKVDLLVMENLFYDLEISKTFDLKGISGRKVKATNKGGSTKTLFDGEWVEDQQRTLTLVRPHSKRVVAEAIRSDAEFLARSNIMDYSLLLGIDEGKKQIACGLVDTIGSYTFAKTLEYKAKHGLQPGNKEVTVVPPADYQERFVNALEGYFVACPDKWSKPVDESKVISDPALLPSVL